MRMMHDFDIPFRRGTLGRGKEKLTVFARRQRKDRLYRGRRIITV